MSLYTLAPQPWLIFLDDAGLYVPNGQLAIYAAGTMTPATTYTSANGIAHPFPITLDSAGRVPGGLYLQPGLSYKFVLHEPPIEEPLDGGILKSQDNIDAVPRSGGSVLRLLNPGDYANLNVGGVDIIEYVGAGDVTIQGMVGGVVGQSLLILNQTASTVWLSHHDPAAPPGAALSNFVLSGPTPIAPGRGSAQYTYVSGSWVMTAHAQGNALAQPYDATNYGTNGAATWAVEPGDIFSESFYLQGKLLIYTFSLRNTSISAPAGALTRRLPAGWQIGALTSTNVLMSTDGTVYDTALATIADGTHLAFQRMPLTIAWAAGVNNTTLQGQIAVPLN